MTDGKFRVVPSKEIQIQIKSAENKGSNKFTVSNASFVIAVIRIYRDDQKTNTANSRVTLDRVYKKGDTEILRVNVVDIVDNSFVIEDLSTVPIDFELIIYEKGVYVEGVIKYV
jgi:hypothetical protein